MKTCRSCGATKPYEAFYKAFNPAIYPLQGQVAFPNGDGPQAERFSAQMERNQDE